ncbi:MAG: hypothetical protein K9L17_11705 [Clostridiales bacterium]|nr:hypothetical protein [Clostridiales bacterium]MCF8023348.1 hypothetical protein [Clostridiales bacterium]
MHPQGSKLRRFLLGLAAFAGPILFGALIVKLGGFLAFWLLCYLLMAGTPFIFIIYLVYKYIFQIKTEKIEDRYEQDAEEFLRRLEEDYTVINECLWNRSMRERSMLERKKPFDRMALSVSEEWHHLTGDEKEKIMKELSQYVYNWIRDKNLAVKNHVIRLDFYTDLTDPSSLVGRYKGGKILIEEQ